MNKNVFPHLIGIGLFLASLALLVACRPGALEPAGAPGVIPAAAAKDIDDPAASNSWADRRSYSSSYASWVASSSSVTELANIEPADRKFFRGANAEAPLVETRSSIDPADHKFFVRGYENGLTVPADADSLQTIDPADRKFLNGNW